MRRHVSRFKYTPTRSHNFTDAGTKGPALALRRRPVFEVCPVDSLDPEASSSQSAEQAFGRASWAP